MPLSIHQISATGELQRLPWCPIEHAVNAALKDVMNEAEAFMLERFGEITLDILGAEFKRPA